jgi:hypothetical protein
MLRQHHVKIQDLAKYLRGYDPTKPQSAEEWSKVESSGFEPGMLIFCLERVSAPSGLAFGKKDDTGETYRVKDLCVVVGRDNNRPLVVNITASAFELRFLEVLMLEKARKAILDGKDFLYVAVRPSMRPNDAKVREIEQLGAVYAQGGSRRTLVVDTSGPPEPAVALLGALGVKLAVGGIGKQVLDIGSVCHMLFTPEGRHEDPNKTIVKQAFTPIANSEPIASGHAVPSNSPALAAAARQPEQGVWQEPLTASQAVTPLQPAPDLYSTPPSPQDWGGEASGGWGTVPNQPAPLPQPVAPSQPESPKTPDLRFSFERTETSTEPSSWHSQQAQAALAAPPAAAEAQLGADLASQYNAGQFPSLEAQPGSPFQAPQYAIPNVPPSTFESQPQYSLPEMPPPTPFEAAPPPYAIPNLLSGSESGAPSPYAIPEMPPVTPFEVVPSSAFEQAAAPPPVPFEAQAQTTPSPFEQAAAPPPMPFETVPIPGASPFEAAAPPPPISFGSNTGAPPPPPPIPFATTDSAQDLPKVESALEPPAGAIPPEIAAQPTPAFSWEQVAQQPPEMPTFSWAPEPTTAEPPSFSWAPAAPEQPEFKWGSEPGAPPPPPPPVPFETAKDSASDSAAIPPDTFKWAPEAELESPKAAEEPATAAPAEQEAAPIQEPAAPQTDDAPAWAPKEPSVVAPEAPEAEAVKAPLANHEMPADDEFSWSTGPETTPPEQRTEYEWAPTSKEAPEPPAKKPEPAQPSLLERMNKQMSKGQHTQLDAPEDQVRSDRAEPEAKSDAEEASEAPKAEPQAETEAARPAMPTTVAEEESIDTQGDAAEPQAPAAPPPSPRLRPGRAQPASDSPFADIKSVMPASSSAQAAPPAEDKGTTEARPRPGRRGTPVEPAAEPLAEDKYKHLAEAITGAEIEAPPQEGAVEEPAAHTTSGITPAADKPVVDEEAVKESESKPQEKEEKAKEEPAPPKAEVEAPAASVRRKSGTFQEPRLVMNEMNMLMNKLEQQVQKAAKKLGGRSEEIKQRLSKEMESLVDQAAEIEKQSQASISNLASKMSKRLDDVSEEVRLKISDVAANGRYTIKHLLTTNQTQVEETKSALYDSVREVCKQFRADTEALTKQSEADLRHLVADRTEEIEKLSREICQRLSETNTEYARRLDARFARFKERMADETDSLSQVLDRNVRYMFEEIEGSWDRASEKLVASQNEFEQTVEHTVKTAQLNASQATRRMLTDQLMPKLQDRKMILRTMASEMSAKFLQESDSQVSGQLLGLEASLGAARQQLQSLVEECMSSIDTVGRGQQAGLEEIFKETSTHAERSTLEVQSLLNRTESQIAETEEVCKKLAETSSADNDPQLTDERSAATARVQQMKQQANTELQSTIERNCERLEQLSQAVQTELTNIRIDQTQSVRDAAESGLSRLREAIQEAFNAIQAAREKYME